MAAFNPIKFFREVKLESAKITWPTRKETTITAVMVIVMSIVASIFFLGVDAAVGSAVQFILG